MKARVFGQRMRRMIVGPVILMGFWAKTEISPLGNYVYEKI